MKSSFQVGLTAEYSKMVTHDMTVEFEGRSLHELCSTYWLSHLAELVSYYLIKPYLEDHENSVGTGLSIRHHASAGVGHKIDLKAVCTEYRGNYVKTEVETREGDRLISTAVVHQVVVSKSYLEQLEADLLAEQKSK